MWTVRIALVVVDGDLGQRLLQVIDDLLACLRTDQPNLLQRMQPANLRDRIITMLFIKDDAKRIAVVIRHEANAEVL